MINKKECIEIFNSSIQNIPISLERLILLISEYLTEINYKNSDKLICLITENQQLIMYALPKIVEYYCVKYTIFSLIYNNKTLLYYE